MKTGFTAVLLTALAGCTQMAMQDGQTNTTTKPHITEDAPSERFCQAARDWRIGSLSPQELCEKYDGSFCSSMKSFGQAICAANGKSFCSDVKTDGEGICLAGDGAFCSSIKSTAGGLCAALKGSFCSDETDEKKWLKKLTEACGWK